MCECTFAALWRDLNKDQERRAQRGWFQSPQEGSSSVPETSLLELSIQLNWEEETKTSMSHLWPCTASSSKSPIYNGMPT